jgi:hypothetical protein
MTSVAVAPRSGRDVNNGSSPSELVFATIPSTASI